MSGQTVLVLNNIIINIACPEISEEVDRSSLSSYENVTISCHGRKVATSEPADSNRIETNDGKTNGTNGEAEHKMVQNSLLCD